MYKHQIRFMDCERVSVNSEIPHVRVRVIGTLVPIESLRKAVEVIQAERTKLTMSIYSDTAYGNITIHSKSIYMVEDVNGIHFVLEAETTTDVDMSPIYIYLPLNIAQVEGELGKRYKFNTKYIRGIDVFGAMYSYINGREIE